MYVNVLVYKFVSGFFFSSILALVYWGFLFKVVVFLFS